MRERDFSRTRHTATANEGGRRRRVMRRSIRVPGKPLGAELTGQGQHGRRFERGHLRHGGQQAGQTGSEHRLAGAGRAGEQDRMPACRSDFEGTLGVRLPAHVGEVGVGVFAVIDSVCGDTFQQRALPAKVSAHFEQRIGCLLYTSRCV